MSNNPRRITKENFDKLKQSIKDNPDYFEARPLIVSNRTGENVIIAGNQRYKASQQLGLEQVPCVVLEGLTEEKEKEIIIRDNVELGEWDYDILADEWDSDELNDWGVDMRGFDDNRQEESNEINNNIKGSLKDKYLEVPFSILDAKKGEWQNRKKLWINKGIKSEVGRDDKLLGRIHEMEKLQNPNTSLTGTSMFDPVLCEIMYSWFSKEEDYIIDPFAGGSVRGIIASVLNRNYVGVDLRQEQIDANRDNAKEVCENLQPVYICGDSNKILDTIENEKFNMCLSCPPYVDLEKYSDNADDLSNMNYNDFITVYQSIIKKLYDKLKDNSFVVWVIGEVRDKKRQLL
ncbi:MAG: ParB N-terminal domain-containing protein [Rickettsiales bacterium]|nr:ParB N-terminal domain-containing protein [Rickettsiales bacterium]